MLNVGSKQVLEYDPKIRVWKYHSQLKHFRTNAIVMSMPNGVYIFGGTMTKILPSRMPMYRNTDEVIQWVSKYFAKKSKKSGKEKLIGCKFFNDYFLQLIISILHAS